MDYPGAALPGPPVRRPLWEQPPVAHPETVPDPDLEPGLGTGLEPDHEPDHEAGLETARSTDVEDEPDAETVEYPDPPQTGDVEVDVAINALAVAVGGPLEEQLAAFDAAHRTLQARLADVEG